MEKEWNERVVELQKAGSTEEVALETATSDPALDEYVTVAPLALFTSIPDSKHTGVRTGQRLGYFPVCASDVIPESFVDFNKVATVHFSLLQRTLRQGSLSDLALAHLQHALAMHFAYRGLSGLENLEAAIGRQIVSVTATNRAKGKIIVNMALDNGQTVTLESVDAGANLRDTARPARS